jgi:hypothetical protein
MIMLPDVEWGSKKIALRFDKHPYAVAEAVPNAALIEQLQGYEPEILNVFERFVEPGDVLFEQTRRRRWPRFRVRAAA